MTNTNALREAIKKSGLKMKYIASELGISTVALNNKINNKVEFKASEIKKLCEILKLTKAEREVIFFN